MGDVRVKSDDVRFGSKADMRASIKDVRFTPESGHNAASKNPSVHRPQLRRATWFALMASLMNLSLVAGALQTKYLNDIFMVSRGDYANLPQIVSWSIAIGFIVPVAAIVALGGRVR